MQHSKIDTSGLVTVEYQRSSRAQMGRFKVLCHSRCLIMNLQKGLFEYLLDKKTKFTGHTHIQLENIQDQVIVHFFFFSSDTQISLQQIERSGQKVRTPLNMAAKGAVKNERIKIVCVQEGRGPKSKGEDFHLFRP